MKVHLLDVNLGPIIGPRAQLYAAVLLVKGKVGDNYLTIALEDDWRSPSDLSRALHLQGGSTRWDKVPIGTEQK